MAREGGKQETYALGGEERVGWAFLDEGLPLVLRWAEAFGVPEGRAVRGTDGDADVAGGALAVAALALLAGESSV